MKKEYIIYLHRNKQNNKIYIGQTSQPPLKRWNNGQGYKTSTKFWNAIQKYGWDNFEHLILFTNLSLEEANRLEEQLIALYKSTDDDYGYNIKNGGSNFTHSDITKQKIGMANKQAQKGKKYTAARKEQMSKLFSGENNPFFGKHHTDETKNKISQSRKGKTSGINHPLYGQHHSQDTLNKMSQNRQGKGGKKVKCLNTNEIFNTMMDAARWCGLSNATSIGQVCNHTGKQKTAGKHPITKEKLFWEFAED